MGKCRMMSWVDVGAACWSLTKSDLHFLQCLWTSCRTETLKQSCVHSKLQVLDMSSHLRVTVRAAQSGALPCSMADARIAKCAHSATLAAWPLLLHIAAWPLLHILSCIMQAADYLDADPTAWAACFWTAARATVQLLSNQQLDVGVVAGIADLPTDLSSSVCMCHSVVLCAFFTLAEKLQRCPSMCHVAAVRSCISQTAEGACVTLALAACWPYVTHDHAAHQCVVQQVCHDAHVHLRPSQTHCTCWCVCRSCNSRTAACVTC